MDSPLGVRRVILVVLDGLRADSVALFPLPQLRALAQRGARTLAAQTVQPSVTAAAMTSLMSGVAPHVHGIQSDRFGLPRRGLTLLPTLLAEHGYPVRAFLASVPRPYRGLAARIAAHVNVDVTFAGDCVEEILRAALASLASQSSGLHILHWPDADRAGHADGWTSGNYARAARRLDTALGLLVHETGVLDDPGTVLIACADHGGGGVDPKDHESRHPLDTTIPIVLAGGQIATGDLAPFTSLLDIPATVAWALGIMPPANYAGRPLVEAFVHARRPARAGVLA